MLVTSLNSGCLARLRAGEGSTRTVEAWLC